MRNLGTWEDAALLAADDSDVAEAFTVFYRRHVSTVLALCARRGLDAHEAADLTSETFAAALLARKRYRSDVGDAGAWLRGIAAHKLADRARRWARERSARERLGLERVDLTDADLADYAVLQDAHAGPVVEQLRRLPDDQRAAVQARVIEERDYPVIARDLEIDEAAARKRVSRGLSALRNRLRDDR